MSLHFKYDIEQLLSQKNINEESLRKYLDNLINSQPRLTYNEWIELDNIFSSPTVPLKYYQILADSAADFEELYEEELNEKFLELIHSIYFKSLDKTLTTPTRFFKLKLFLQMLLVLLFSLALTFLPIGIRMFNDKFGPHSDYGKMKFFKSEIEKKYSNKYDDITILKPDNSTGSIIYNSENLKIGHIYNSPYSSDDNYEVYDNFQLSEINEKLTEAVIKELGKEGLAFYSNSNFTLFKEKYEDQDVFEFLTGKLHQHYPSQQYIFFLYNGGSVKNRAFDKYFAKKVQALQNKYKINICAIGIMDQYYSTIEHIDKYKLSINMSNSIQYEGYDFPICPFFVTDGYWNGESDSRIRNWYHKCDMVSIEEGCYFIPQSHNISSTISREQLDITFTKDTNSKELILSSPTGELEKNYYIIDREKYNIPENANVYLNKHGSIACDKLSISDIGTCKNNHICYHIGKYLVINLNENLSQYTQITIPYEK